ncbi:phage tail assembly protein [Rhizobium sp. 0TCS1.26]|uniref:phage tail assembly protein n=1 Tax=Rhizobium sp. 0TCS1.26 TaxID=3142623 RepID=UPI003D2AB64B
MTQEVTSITVPLARPLTNGDSQIPELTFQEADVGQLIDASDASTEMERVSRVLASMCGTSYEVFRKVKSRDFKTIMERCGPLMGNEAKEPK